MSVLSRPTLLARYCQNVESTAAYYEPRADAWMVSRLADILAVLCDAARYSAIALGEDAHPIQCPDDGHILGVAETLLASDPPRHTYLRRYLASALGPSRVTEYKKIAHVAVAAALQQLRAETRAEIINEVCAPVIATVIAAVFGVAAVQASDVARWLCAFSNCNAQLPTAHSIHLIECARAEIWAAVQRSSEVDSGAQSGLFADLARAHANGALKAAQIIDLCSTLLQGSADTVSHLVGNALVMLHNTPEIFTLLRENTALIVNVVESSLHWDSPVQMTIRQTTQCVELGGVSIPQRALLLLLIGQSSRNSMKQTARNSRCSSFENIAKAKLAFGAGAHRCPGSLLARMLAQQILEVMVQELDCIHVNIESLICVKQSALLGPKQLEITFNCIPISKPLEHADALNTLI